MRYQKFLALLPLLLLCGAPTFSAAGVDVSFTVNVAPPMLPVYEQPPLPEPGYLWTPGYWAWDGMDYFWVPGTWVQPPVSDMLWTPGYWGWRDGFYGWNPGYWGTEVGYYGGVNYGYGYTGIGYQGGYWHGGAFFYNRSVANFGQVRIVNVYDAPIQVHETSRISFNGGQGGLRYRPNATERMAMNAHHVEPTPMQRQHQEHAAGMPALHLSQNGGRPQILTTQRAADFDHPGPGRHAPFGAGEGARAPAGAPQRAETEQPHVAGPGPGLHNHAQLGASEGNRAPAAAPQRAEAEQPHLGGPAPAMRGPGPAPEHGGSPGPAMRGPGTSPEVHGGPPPGQGPRPQISHEQGRHEPAPKREEPKHEAEPKH